MDQRKLMDNANTITDMAKVRINVGTNEGQLFSRNSRNVASERTEMKDQD